MSKYKEAQALQDLAAGGAERRRIGAEVSVVQPEDAPSRARKRVAKGCVIYSTVRPYLRNIAVLDRDFVPAAIVSTAFSVLMPYTGVNVRFLYYYLRSQSFVEYVEDNQKGIAYPAINDGDFQRGPVPVPPTQEQHRIVARVDELMSLIDRLEQQLTTAHTTHTSFAAAAVHHLDA